MGGKGSGGRPKSYPCELVAKVEALYADGLTQAEVAAMTGVSQKVVWRLMARHNIARRPCVVRDQRGEKNAYWKGDKATYAAMHLRVQSVRGAPLECENCGTDNKSLRYEWASITGNYADVNDYKRLCKPCHSRFDLVFYNLGAFARRKHLTRSIDFDEQ